MKIIKVSNEVHKKLVEDKKNYTKKEGMNYRFTDVIKKYQTKG
jgi:uncharacterized protein YutD